MLTTRHARRIGFSLIELLVVIALLSLLAALAAGTYFRIRNGQLVTTTESSLQKINAGLDRIWSAERDRAEKEFNEKRLPNNIAFTALTNFCGGNNETDRARAVWMTARMKQDFPQTFAEARANVTIGPSLVLPARATFANVPATSPGTGPAANVQAAALLYMILTEKGNRGETFDSDSLNAFTREQDVNGTRLKLFIDAWGTPITFARFFNNDEVSEPPFARNTTAIVNADNRKSNNPFDSTASIAALVRPWSNRTTFLNNMGIAVGDVRLNCIATAISAGPNKEWDNLDVRGGNAASVGYVKFSINATSNIESDNMFGYRLRQQAARGD
jgi:prepilin-type N-terminal cleavage/methylation domain-containing protein